MQLRVYCIALYISIHVFQFLYDIIGAGISFDKRIIGAAVYRDKCLIIILAIDLLSVEVSVLEHEDGPFSLRFLCAVDTWANNLSFYQSYRL